MYKVERIASKIVEKLEKLFRIETEEQMGGAFIVVDGTSQILDYIDEESGEWVHDDPLPF